MAAGGVWPPLVGSVHLRLMAPVPVLTEGNRGPDRTGRAARVMTWSSINSKPGAMISETNPNKPTKSSLAPRYHKGYKIPKREPQEVPIKGGQEGRLHPMGTRTNSMSPCRAALCPLCHRLSPSTKALLTPLCSLPSLAQTHPSLSRPPTPCPAAWPWQKVETTTSGCWT